MPLAATDLAARYPLLMARKRRFKNGKFRKVKGKGVKPRRLDRAKSRGVVGRKL